jgi:glycosyltransferase involved in cell wall biosynthesis
VKARRIVIGGLPYFGRMLASLLTGDGWEARYVASAGLRPGGWISTAAAIGGADLVYLVGGQVERWSRPDWLARVTRVPIVMHWIGSDVTYALAAARRGRASRTLITSLTHWAEVDWTARELEPLGITADRVALTPARLNFDLPPLPENFTVLTYLPQARPSFYGLDRVIALASALPEVRFLVAGSDGSSLTTQNLEFLGWVTGMRQVYARTSVLVRLPDHDGLSFMVLEAMASGRHVIWNHPFAGVSEAHSSEEALVHLRRLIDQHRSGSLQPNLAGREYVQASLSPEAVRSEILGRFSSIVEGRGGNQRPSAPAPRSSATSDSE